MYKTMKIIITVGLGFCLCLCAVLPVFAMDDGDFQIWNAESVEGKLNDRLKLKLEEELRFGDNAGELYYTHTDGGITVSVTDSLDLGMKYRQIYEKKNGKWKEENRPHFNAAVKWACQGFKFKDRSRIECRVREDKDDTFRYRNKLSLDFPVKWTRFDIQPYIADEIFIDFDGEKFNRNRLYAGFKAKLFKHLKTDIFYLWQSSEKSDKWIDYNVIGVKVKAVF